MTLTEFLAARLDEDERLAQQALDEAQEPAERTTRYPYPEQLARCMHDARHGPARVLREVEADRALLRRYENANPSEFPDFDGGYLSAIEDVLAIRATRFSDHPDYDEAWRP